MTSKKKSIKAQATEEIQVLRVSQGRVEFCILGLTPLILNRLSEKARHELMLPRGRLTSVDKELHGKHDVLAEFRASAHQDMRANAPTRLLHVAGAFKAAMASVAIDLPGTVKSQIGRLTGVPEEYVAIYGVPKVLIRPVRLADMNKTPDIRTRAIIPEWACRVTVTYIRPLLTDQIIANLLAAAGIMRGTGDWRPEKGAGSYGQFELVSASDPRFAALLKSGGRLAQENALTTPECYDAESAEMLTWFVDEMERRKQRRGESSSKSPKESAA